MKTFQQDFSKYVQALAEHSKDIFWIKSPDYSTQLYISPAYETIWGRSCQSMYTDPKSWTDYLFHEDFEHFHETIEGFKKAIKPGSSYTETYRIERPDGKVFWIKEKGTAIFDDKGNLIGIGGVSQDITTIKENERVEAAVLELSAERDTHEEFMRAIIESIAGNHWWKDRDGVYRGYNRTLLKSLGYNSAADIIGKTDYELPWAETADLIVAHDKEVMRRGVAIEREESVVSNTGKKCVYLVNKAPLRNSAGKIIGTLGHGVDITELKQAQENLEKAKKELEIEKGSIESCFNTAIELLATGHWVKDINGYYTGCNKAMLDFFRLKSKKDLIGKCDSELPWKAKAKSIEKFDREVIKTEKVITREACLKGSDGKNHYFLISKAPMRDSDGNIIGIIANSTDITEQKRIQKEFETAKNMAEVANRAKSTFLAVVSHELRTPLNSILGTTEILSRKVFDADIKNNVEDIRNAADSLLTLVNDILDSTGLEQGNYTLCSEPFEVKKLVEIAVNNIDYKLIDTQTKIHWQCDSQVPKIVIGDSFRLKQVLLNLLDNALKFTKQGRVDVSIGVKAKDNHSILLQFKISDTGIGIAEEEQKKIFQRYAQADVAYGRNARSVGLGLSICKQIIEAMGGEISVASKLGAGSCFSFTAHFQLPELQGSKTAPSQADVRSDDQQFSFSGIRTLLVEDNVLNQKVTKVLLNDLGCSVDIASNGSEALKLAKDHVYDIILMDVGLPEMDGISVARKMRTNPSIGRTPIIALTAHVLEKDIQNCYDAKMDDVLTKPTVLDDFKRILKKYCAPTKEAIL